MYRDRGNNKINRVTNIKKQLSHESVFFFFFQPFLFGCLVLTRPADAANSVGGACNTSSDYTHTKKINK